MPTTALTTALDALWEAIRTDHPELPPARVALSSATSSQIHGPHRWSLDDGQLTGLVLSHDTLSAGAEAVVTHMLHEAAHVLSWVRNVSDGSNRGVYHSGVFLDAAESLCLEWPTGQAKSPSRGADSVVLSTAARERWSSTIAALRPLIDGALPRLAPQAEQTRTRTERLTLVCSCVPPRRIRAARMHVEVGPIVCGVCGETFARQG